MTAFIWMVILVAAIELLANLSWLVKAKYPSRTPIDSVCNVIWSVIAIAWAVALLT